MIAIEKYNPIWEEYFYEFKSTYEDNISDVKYIVEHVGSTSVKGLCAKPIIDIVIVYYQDSDFENLKIQLESIGYKHIGDLGITNREAFKYIGDEKRPKHHLYVCLDGILALRNQILFRDYLRENKDVSSQYCRLKKELAKQYDRDEYCYYKTEFITGILKKYGLSDEEIDAIKLMNKI